MLKQITCNKFIEPILTFKNGLNVVIGDDIASNSIGKSTILMIIDFVFGGDSYINANKDAIENLGHHEFKFKFVFGKEEFFFIRSTKDYKYTKICDEKYNPINTVKTEKFSALLKEKYKITLNDLSFRNIVGRYARVYGKENLNEKKPLQYFEKEKSKASILTLIKLFDKYKIIKEYELQINKLSEEKSILLKAIKNEFIPKITKTIFTENEKKVAALNLRLDNLRKEIVGASVDIEALLTKDILELKSEKSHLIKQYNLYESRLKRTKQNISQQKLNIESELAKLVEFFPDVNLDKIVEINSFHHSLTGILKEELKQSEIELSKQIKLIISEIEKVDQKIEAKLNIKNAPNYTFEQVIDLSAQIKQLLDENSFYMKRKTLEDNLSSAKEDIADIRNSITADISNQINNKMYEINKLVYTDNRRAPSFSINEESYIFSTFNDTGTGTAFANLITFDLALLEITPLPVIIHDLPLLKNIQNEALENIIKLYLVQNKQIFIAIDKIHTYNKETAKALEDNKFLRLSKDKTLFILNWKNNNLDQKQ